MNYQAKTGMVRLSAGADGAPLEDKFWRRFLELISAGQDVCVAEIVTLGQATQDRHIQERGLFKRQLKIIQGEVLSALPTPLSQQFLSPDTMACSPTLGQHTDEIL